MSVAGDGEMDFQLRQHLANLLVALYSFNKRQELRRRFGGDPGPFCCQDFWCWWCCAFCTATQEARTVDGAAGLQSKCCCNLVPVSVAMGMPGRMVVMAAPPAVMGTPVGAPVAVGTVVAPQSVPVQAVAVPECCPGVCIWNVPVATALAMTSVPIRGFRSDCTKRPRFFG